jgi:hypothetical protein
MRARQFTSAREEIRFYEDNPHLPTPGFTTFTSLSSRPIEDYADELEFLPQDKSATLEYKIAHEIEKP